MMNICDFYVAPSKEKRYKGIALSVCLSLQFNIGYNFAISYYFFKTLYQTFKYIAYDDTDTMMLNSLGQRHICWNFAPFFDILAKHLGAT